MTRNELVKLRENIESLKVSDKKLIGSYQDGYIGKNTYQITYQDGTTKICEQITKNKGNGDAVVIIPITVEGDFIMILESRPNVDNLPILEFPAGMIDKGEKGVTSARRELLEETGYEAEDITLFDTHYQDQGCSSAIIETFIATGCKKVSKQDLDEGERIEVVLLPYDEVVDILNNEEELISDANTKLGLLKLILKRKGE